MRALCCIAALILAATTGAFAYLFLWRGEVAPASDGRTAILLAPSERDLVLSEMRAFLQASRQILDAASRGAVDDIAEAARSVGATAQHAVPASLVGKLPAEFKMLGFDTHSQFDILAADAEKLGDPTHSLQQLAGLMRNCVACHAAYRIDLTGP